jgi:two-component system, OmpR family, sensor histidine kinase KdpD
MPHTRSSALRELVTVGTRTAASAGAVAVVTAAIFVLREGAPVLSLGVLYLFAVLPVAALWGLGYAIAVAVGSMAAFNFFFFPPVHTFHIADGENWLALTVYLVTAVVVSELAARARRRAAEAEQREREDALLAELSRALVQGRRVEDELDRISAGVATLFQSERAAIELTTSAGGEVDESPHELVADGRLVGTLYVSGPRAVVRGRFLSALASLLAVGLDRERLASEALQAETLRRSDAVKTAVLRTVSHDLRTPLTAIRVAAEGLASPTLEISPADRAGLLDTIRAEATRLQRVVADLLDLSRLQAGVAEPDTAIWTFDELLSQALDGLSGEGSRVHVEVPEEIPPVHVDAVQIERVLINLLDNALKFSPPDQGVRVDVGRKGEELVIRVSNRGPRLSADELDQIFEPFHTGGEGERHGSGLGLAIARGFAEANGGRVWAESQRGGGATFSLALPVAHVPVVLRA